MQFELQHTDVHSDARAGKITTDHGIIETPIFMPVGRMSFPFVMMSLSILFRF